MAKYPGLDCIVLVDDDAATNFIHKIIIESAGIEAHIQICDCGEMALNYLNCEGEFDNESKFPQPGIIFLDINMPGMNGWEFLEHYHKLPENRKAKIVVAMLTTSLNPDDRSRAVAKEDVKTFLSKPLLEEQVLKIVEENFYS